MAQQGQEIVVEYLSPTTAVPGPLDIRAKSISLVRDQEAMVLANRLTGKEQLVFPAETGPRQLTVQVFSAATVCREFKTTSKGTVGFNKAIAMALSEARPLVSVLAKTVQAELMLLDSTFGSRPLLSQGKSRHFFAGLIFQWTI